MLHLSPPPHTRDVSSNLKSTSSTKNLTVKKMKQKELSELTDQELLDEAKKMRSSSIAHAFVIGLMIGIVVFSVAKNTWGLFTLIPLFFIYKLTRNPNNNEELKRLLKERNLK
jgi:hypothetical protein